MTTQSSLLKQSPHVRVSTRHDREQESPRALGLPHIVMIEDNSEDVGLLLLAIEEVGITALVHPVANAPQTHALMRDLQAIPALIILDINLPVIRGDELLLDIKSSGTWMSVPLVVFSSSHVESDIEKCFSLGAAAFKTKPSTFQGFMDFARSLHPFLLPARA